ncbi:acetyltransferase [Aphelenchoides avenae]|nr:acetyltransferase [Aphelenchus avenae]
MTTADFVSAEQSDEIRIEQMRKSDVDAVHKFILGDFRKFEPMNAAMELSVEEADEFFKELVEAADPQVSYLAKAADGRLAGVGLACIIHRPSASDANGGESAFKPEGECFKVREIKRIIFELESKIRDYIIWSLVPSEVKSLLYWIIVSVHGNFKRRGIARKLVTHNLDVPKRMACQGIITEASAFNSQQLFAKLGYRTLAEIHHKDWTSDAGSRIFSCSDGTEKIVLTYKEF